MTATNKTSELNDNNENGNNSNNHRSSSARRRSSTSRPKKYQSGVSPVIDWYYNLGGSRPSSYFVTGVFWNEMEVGGTVWLSK